MLGTSTRSAPVTAPQILIVDDDLSMRHMVRDYLQLNNMTVVTASNGHDMPRLLAAGSFNLIILDLRLGEEDGLDLLRDLRTRSDLPVIIMTGHRRDEIDRVVGLELGADDYILKPFSLRELLARIRVVLRRSDGSATSSGLPLREHGSASTRLGFAGWILDRRTRQLTNPEGAPVILTKSEYALLNAFLATPQCPLSREQLLQATRINEDVFDRSIDVQILRLRRKLESDPSTPSVIRTERGVGYIFTLAVQPV